MSGISWVIEMEINDLSVGDELPVLEKKPTRPQLFRYSAMTWNPHRIHYDPEYAREIEGHPDVLVPAQMQGAAIQELLMGYFGPDGRLTELSWQNVGRATPEDTISIGAKVTEIDAANREITFDVWTETGDHSIAEGEASVHLVTDSTPRNEG